MRITKFAIQDFLSLRNTGEVSLDPYITVLLGKNEHGKTNLLVALESFDRESQYNTDDLCYYSESQRQVESGETTPSEVPIVTLWFEAERGDKARLAAVDQRLGKAKTLRVTKYLDNHYTFEVDGQTLDALVKGDLAQVIEHEEAMDDILAGLDTLLAECAARHTPFQESMPTAKEAVASFRTRYKTAEDDLPAALIDLRGTLDGLANRDALLVEQVADAMEALEGNAEELMAAREATPKTYRQLLGVLPRFVYFDDVDLLEDSVAIDEFLANRKKHGTLANLVWLVDLNVERLKKERPFHRRQATEIASADITGRINESWKQEKVTVSINCDGEHLFIIVKDEKGGYDPPSKRSKGFQWYLGFYINFHAGSGLELENTVLLLDDPGVYLHVAGQKDLLKTIEGLSKGNQFVIATHSPFLIDRQHLDRIRIVEKQEEELGTTFKEKWYESERDAFAPIRAALGMTLGDSLALGQQNIVAEGVSDLYILSGMSRVCERLGRPFLDTDKMSVIPAGGATNVPYLTAILYKEKLPVVTVLDHDSEGRKARKRMVEEMSIPDRLCMTLEEFGAGPECTDVELEDLIDAKFYYKAFAVAYADFFEEKGVAIPQETDLAETQCSRTKPYQDRFKKRKLGGFDKTAVARQLMMMCDDRSASQEVESVTVDKFAGLFEAINAILAGKS